MIIRLVEAGGTLIVPVSAIVETTGRAYLKLRKATGRHACNNLFHFTNECAS